MGRKDRQDCPGAIHHVFNRGMARRTVTETPQDVRDFLACFARMVHRGFIEILAYSILRNHFHLILRSVEGSLSKAVGMATNRYVRKFNRIRKRDGSLFRGRFGSELVDSEEYLHTLVRYTDLNAVKAGLARHPADYPFGSARHYCSPKGPIWLAREHLERRVRARSADGTFTATGYFAMFSDRATEGELALVEHRMAHPSTAPDPLDDLIGASPRQVRIVMINRARKADGTAPGVPVTALSTLEEVFEDLSVDTRALQVVPGSRRVESTEFLLAGLLRLECRLDLREIAQRMGCSKSKVSDLVRHHRNLLLEVPDYAELAAQILSRAIQRDFPGLPPTS